MKQINIVLGTEGIAALKAYLLNLQTNLHTIVRKSEEAIAEYGARAMEEVAPTTDIDGNLPGSIAIEPAENGMRVAYSGDDVAYIEFGTGYIGKRNPYPDEAIFNKAGWKYDVNEHGPAGWVYRRKWDGAFRHSRGMMPEAPVLESFKKTERAVPQIVREVMNEEFGG